MFCAYTRPRYQVSVYRTIGLLVILNYAINYHNDKTLVIILFFSCLKNINWSSLNMQNLYYEKKV